jgi:hypothetical protein
MHIKSGILQQEPLMFCGIQEASKQAKGKGGWETKKSCDPPILKEQVGGGKKEKYCSPMKNKRKGGRGKRKTSPIRKECEIRREKENCSPISRRERKIKGKGKKNNCPPIPKEMEVGTHIQVDL